jgi:iron-sulfur cluster assembly protein
MEYKITVSELAASAIIKKLAERNSSDAFIRLGVRGGGCSGFTYQLSFEDVNPTDKDLTFISNGINIVVDKKSILYLNGTQLDWENKLMYTGFKFINPLEQSSCGCGHSVVINKEQS